MIVHLNSYPGVRKLTIGALLMGEIDGKLLDNHSIYNVAFALTEFKSAAFYESVRSVRQIAYARVLTIPVEAPVILTNAHAQNSKWGKECWNEVISLARLSTVLCCSAIRMRTPDAFRAATARPGEDRLTQIFFQGIEKDAHCSIVTAMISFSSTSPTFLQLQRPMRFRRG